MSFTFVQNGSLKKLFIFPIRLYQRYLSPLLGQNCRFDPTCSHFAVEAIEEWGVMKGIWMGARRIAKCHPWGGFGYDPVPKKDTTVKK
ncbi:MAG: membrane protein insertion efficiency factor YidD [Flavobacteriales bacterium]|jgi:putative membrane protein insertion efficiency factor